MNFAWQLGNKSKVHVNLSTWFFHRQRNWNDPRSRDNRRQAHKQILLPTYELRRCSAKQNKERKFRNRKQELTQTLLGLIEYSKSISRGYVGSTGFEQNWNPRWHISYGKRTRSGLESLVSTRDKILRGRSFERKLRTTPPVAWFWTPIFTYTPNLTQYPGAGCWATHRSSSHAPQFTPEQFVQAFRRENVEA